MLRISFRFLKVCLRALSYQDLHVKFFFNCREIPIIKENDRTDVLDIFNIPELHLYQGIINLIWNHMEKEFENSDFFLKTINLNKEAYQGGTFEGPQCKKSLESIEILRELTTSDLSRYVDTFESFDLFSKSCFGKELHP